MGEFKLTAVSELFPDKAKKLEKEDRKTNYGYMFDIDVDKKKKIVKFVIDCVEESKKQREAWLEIRRECINNYEGIRKNNGPWVDSSNISTMVTTIAVDMIHSKLFPMVWNPDLVYWKGTTSHSEEIADNNKIFSQWIFTKDMEDTQERVDDIVQSLVLDGTTAVKRVWEKKFVYVTRVVPISYTAKGEIKYETVYDKVKRERARWIVKDIEHVYFPYNACNEDDAEYIVDEVFYTLPILRELKVRGLILDTVDLDEVKLALEKKYEPTGGTESRLHAAGIETITERIESMPIKCYEGYVKYDINDDDLREDCVFLVLPDLVNELGYLSGKPLHCVSRINKRPWKIAQFLRRKGIAYGKGIPELVRHLHDEVDAIHNQRIDAGNMVIAPFFFYRAASGFDPKTISVRPGMGIPLDDPQRDVYFPDYNPSRLSVSFQEEAIIMDLISKLTYLPPSSFGRENSSRPTARGTIALIAEAGQPFNLLASRVMKTVMGLVTDTRKMYEEHWNNDYARSILDEKGRQHWSVLSPEMIAGDYLAFSEVDLETSNSAFEKQADQILYQSLFQDPFVNQNPSFAWELRANYIKSLGKKNVEKYIGPKPDYEMNPGLVDDENQLILRQIQVRVNPKDDHVVHMNGHLKFKREMANVLTPEALTQLSMHIEEHRFEYSNSLQQMAMVQNGENGSMGSGMDTGMEQNNPSLGMPTMNRIQGPRMGNMGGSQQQPQEVGSAY